MIKLNGENVELNKWYDGPFHLKLTKSSIEPVDGSHLIEWVYDSEEELVVVKMIANELRMRGEAPISLFLPYLPNARMDRIEDKVDSDYITVFTLRHFVDFLKELNFKEITVLDPHSDYIMKNMDNVTDLYPISQIEYVVKETEKQTGKRPVLFYPDAGAKSRYGEVLSNTSLADYDVAYGIKERTWGTNVIESYKIDGKIHKGHPVVIIDDICSLGGTFIHAGEELRKVGVETINLYITHCEQGIFVRHLLKENSPIDKVYTTDSIMADNKGNDKLEIIRICRN